MGTRFMYNNVTMKIMSHKIKKNNYQKGFPGSRFWRSSSSTPKNIGVSSKFTTGFTLIELLVVISIISLLSSVVLASISNARVKTRDAQRYQNMKQIKNAIELYFAQNGFYPTCGGSGICESANLTWTSTSTLGIVPTYISRVKNDPINGWHSDGKIYSYMYLRGSKKTGVNTYTSPGTTTDYILGMRLEDSSAPTYNFVNSSYEMNYLDGN